MSEWKEYRLDELSEIIMGLSPSGDTYNEDGIGIPLLNGPTEFGETYPFCTVYTTDPKRICKKGDLIFCVRGSTTGRMNWADKPYAIGRGVCSITGNDEMTTKYIKHLLTLNLPALLQVTGGGTFPNLRKEDINGFKFLASNNYRNIASILSTYDDMIENNLKRIMLLEEIAQRTYEEWFIKFRINGVQLELGENGLPEGWERKRLEDCIINYDNKRKPLSKMVREEKQGIYPYYGAAGIIDYINDFIFDGRYLLIGEDGTVITPKGNAMLQFVEGKFWVSNHAHVVLGKHLTTTEFIYCFLNNYPISQHITGAAQPKISQMNLNRIELNVGDEKIMNDFNSFIKNVINQIFNLSHQNGLLKESRDILLPRLMSGKVGV
jgi:type I restriction enzyme S subunit